MASTKTSKHKVKGAGSAEHAGDEKLSLRTRTDARYERRFEPKPTAAGLLPLIGVLAGALLAGAGTYAQWLRPEELGSLAQAPYLLSAGTAMLALVLLFGHHGPKPVRVGDAGIALEKDPGDIERIAWKDVSAIAVTGTDLTVHAGAKSIVVSASAQPQAVARIVAEALARIPKKAGPLAPDAFEKVDDSAGEVIPLETPQVAGQKCRETGKPIAFERDARLCGKCGEVYHRESVPKRCATCDARLAT